MTADYDEADVEAAAEIVRGWGMGPMNFQQAADKLLAAVAPSIAAKARADERERIAQELFDHIDDFAFDIQRSTIEGCAHYVKDQPRRIARDTTTDRSGTP